MTSPYRLPNGFTSPHLLSGMAEGTPVLVGFSGGADSTSLLHMLSMYGKQTNTLIYAAHVNHGIRGAEADRDEEFCKQLCGSLGIQIFSVKADVPKLAEEWGEGIESAARRFRYAYFAGLMKENNIPILATAHNANDNLETILFNLSRGASLNGICGIPQFRPCDGGIVVRPILSLSKDEILGYCRDHSLEYVTDSTNTDTDYTRNKIRAEIIPRLCEINSGAVRNAARLSESLRTDALCLEEMTNSFLKDTADGSSMDVKMLNSAPDAIVNRAIISMYKSIADNEALEHTHVCAIKELSRKAIPHSSATLPGGVEARIENKHLIFAIAEPKKQISSYDIPLNAGEHFISQAECEIIIGYSQNTKNIYKNSILMTIDSAKINGCMRARSRHEGDRIFTCGMHKSVKKLMCDKKIPLELRSRLPIIYDDDGIVCIPTLAIRDGARCKDSTESAIQIRIILQ